MAQPTPDLGRGTVEKKSAARSAQVCPSSTASIGKRKIGKRQRGAEITGISNSVKPSALSTVSTARSSRHGVVSAGCGGMHAPGELGVGQQTRVMAATSSGDWGLDDGEGHEGTRDRGTEGIGERHETRGTRHTCTRSGSGWSSGTQCGDVWDVGRALGPRTRSGCGAARKSSPQGRRSLSPGTGKGALNPAESRRQAGSQASS